MEIRWSDIGGLSRAYERFVAGGEAARDVRPPILTSWRRCKALGLEPDRLTIPYEEDLDSEGRLLHVAGPVLDQLEAALRGTRVCIILADAQARVLQRRAGDRGLNRSLDEVQLAVGFSFAEQIAGTNGIGTALAERRPSFVLGREHFAECMEPFACAGAPIRHPLSGRMEGVLDLTCLRVDANPAMIRLVHKAANDIERRLLEQSAARERELLDAFLRSRAGEAEPLAVPSPGGNAGPAGALRSVEGGHGLDRGDEARLRQKAAELISSPHQSTAQVMLSGGRVATLVCRPVTDSPGQTGVAVEARVVGAPPERIAPVPVQGLLPPAAPPVLGPPELGETPPPAADADHLSVITSAPQGRTDEWLLLLGEPGVGQLAVQARQRLTLLYDAGVRIGTTLDVTRTAEELADVAVPELADFVTVDLFEPVLAGADLASAQNRLRRVAMGGIREESGFYPVAEPIAPTPSSPQARCLASCQPVLEPSLADAPGWQIQDLPRTGKILASGVHSLIAVPMQARGTLLGMVCFYRSEEPLPFEEDELSLAEELAGRAALCIDNARRYTREHATALALQRSLLPRRLLTHSTVEVAHRYLPAHAGVGGDWYDVIPLSGARVALVVGDVVGHGVHAAATMGRLRTAVHNFAALDMPVDDLLSSLNDVVEGLDADREGTGESDDASDSQVIGATCLYAVYDPVTRRCTLARAGHPLPALVLPDGTVEFPDVPAGPPLGLGGLPFETIELEIPEGSQLVLYSDGLIEDRTRDIDVGLSLLRQSLTVRGRTPEETCDAVLEALLPDSPSDDVALLIARLGALDPRHVAAWNVAPEPENVARMRATVRQQLERWELPELVPATELIVSELVTNAIRYARNPISMRLLRDRSLICEVSDGSNTSPRMRRASITDEGGRGLFLVAQAASRWGTRYTSSGKVIWSEQPLPPSASPGATHYAEPMPAAACLHR